MSSTNCGRSYLNASVTAKNAVPFFSFPAGPPPHVRFRFRLFRTAISHALSTIQKGTASSLVYYFSNKPFLEFSTTSTPNCTISPDLSSLGSLSSEPLLRRTLFTNVPLLLLVSCKKNWKNKRKTQSLTSHTKQNNTTSSSMLQSRSH